MRSVLACLILLVSFNSQASLDHLCNIEGKFQAIVYDTFGWRWALDQTSYGLALYDKESGETLCEEYVQPTKKIYPASTIKTLIAMGILKQVDTGLLSMDQKIEINQVNAKDECSFWDCSLYGPGKKRTIEQLIWDMITVSNNLATNQLMDVAGKERLTQMAKEIEAPSLKIFRKVYDEVNPEPWIKKRNEANGQDLVRLYREVATGRLNYLSERSRLFLVNALKNQKYNGSLNDHFPSDVIFYHKTGSTSKVTGDGGFYYPSEDVVAVLVGLQDFNRYRVCREGGGCFWRRGYWSLGRVGQKSFEMVERLL